MPDAFDPDAGDRTRPGEDPASAHPAQSVPGPPERGPSVDAEYDFSDLCSDDAASDHICLIEIFVGEKHHLAARRQVEDALQSLLAEGKAVVNPYDPERDFERGRLTPGEAGKLRF